MSTQKIEITVSSKTIIRIAIVLVGLFLSVRIVATALPVVKLFITAAFLSIALNPAIHWLRRKLKLKSRVSATAIAFISIVLVVGSLAAATLPTLFSQTYSFVKSAPETIVSITRDKGAIGTFIRNNQLQDELVAFSTDIQYRTKNIREPVVSSAGRLGSALVSIIAVLTLTFMLLVEGPLLTTKFWNIVPVAKRSHHQKLAARMYEVVTGYVNGQLLLATLASVLTLVSLLVLSKIFNVSVNAVALAGVAFLTGLMPIIGNIVGGVIVVLTCLFVSFPLAIAMAVLLTLYQQIENMTLQPIIQAKFNELTPLLVFIGALLGAQLGGILGAIIAIPALGCAKILVFDTLKRKRGKVRKTTRSTKSIRKKPATSSKVR
jgi:predicted PurR-regulated permease PerM